MKRFYRLIFLTLFLIGLSILSFAQNKNLVEKDKNELAVVYSKLDTARKNRDIKTFEKYFDEVYEFVSNSGSKTQRAEIINLTKELFAEAEEITESVTKIEKIEKSDGKYYLETFSVLKGTCHWTDDKTFPFEIQTKSTDLWTKEKGKWKLKTQIIREGRIFIDGEPVFIN